jgi:hypothetical protein
VQKKLLFRIQQHRFQYKNGVFPLFNDFVKKVNNSFFFTIFQLFVNKKHSNTMKSDKLDKGFQMVYKLS